MFLIISGCSGSGKNTIINKLIERNSKIKFFKTCTTRQIRPEEVGRSNYIHLSKEEFKNKIKNNELFEHEEIHGNYYGILNSSIDNLKKQREIYVKDIGVLGQKNLVESLKNVKIISIFLDVPKDELINRLVKRGEKYIEKRMERFEMENAQKHRFDFVIENKNLDKTILEIEKIIEKANA